MHGSMAMDQRNLKQDGYLDVGDEGIFFNSDGPTTFGMRNIVFHPQLNVLLAFGDKNVVKVLDVNSGSLLQTFKLSTNGESYIQGRYMPLQDKILFWDGHNVGLRGDYNGVLLLDTILQPPINQNDDKIKLELILSEAIMLQTCIDELEFEGLECPADVSNELGRRIYVAKQNAKKSIKAQRWNTICLKVSYSSFKMVASNVVSLLKRLERHIPVMAIASAINERLTDMLVGSRVPDATWNYSNYQRVLMHSEAVRRQTFEKWPHMDYKWALPDQMAQAGFYHQPSSSGEDRAMCFTCNVCLVCWEKTDEPWSEHERHSPLCPFVKGEYTQNVPLSITYATNPAQPAPGPFNIVSNSDYANVLCTSCTQSGDLSVWSIERHLKLMQTFHVPTLLKEVFEENFEWARVTAICVLPNERARTKVNHVYSTNYSSGSGMSHSSGMHGGGKYGSGSNQQMTSTSTLRAGVVGSKIVLGVSLRQSSGEMALRMVVLKIVKVDRQNETSTHICDGIAPAGGSKPTKVSLEMSNATNETNIVVTQVNTESKDDDNKSLMPYEKFADGFDSNGFVSALMTYNKNNGVANSADNASVLYDFDLSTLSNMMDSNLEDPAMLMGSSNTVNVTNSLISMNNEMEKLIDEAAVVHQQNNNNNNDNSSLLGLNNNNMNGISIGDKTPISEEIDCVIESWTSVKRMNALSNTGDVGAQGANEPLADVEEIVEIAEIIPTSPKCNQLLVRMQRTKAPETDASQIIMATVAKEEEEQDELMEIDDINSDCDVVAQLLLFDYDDTQISNDNTLAITFSRAKRPKQVCIVPPQVNADQKETGSICVVCADGIVELFSLSDFQTTTIIEEEGEHFEAVAYCRNMERLCCCSRQGGLLFYSLTESDNDSGDEMLDIEDDCNTTLAQINAGGDLCVTDGGRYRSGADFAAQATAENPNSLNEAITVDVCMDGAGPGTSAAGSNGHVQTSPSGMSLAANSANLLAYKTADLTIEDLRVLYALTQFDDKLTVYSAEVPSCWNDLGQVQKQRKQSQNMRHGNDERDFTRTWRLHNDATTWDEHIIELNLAQPVSLGHIDLKFTVYQQCSNPAGIQVTLLKQYTNGFGYRTKGSHGGYMPINLNENIDLSYSANENPVLSEEYLLAHNAEVLAGPIELSSCIDQCDQGGTATLTSPKLFKTRTRSLLLHIKTVSDPSKEGQAKTRGCDWLHEISISVRGVKTHNRINNGRMQRIAMLDSNVLLEQLFKTICDAEAAALSKNIALDVLNWICFIRLNRFRSPKSERIKDQINKHTAGGINDLLAQQFECVCLAEKYIEQLMRNCIIHSERTTAHKCVKLLVILTEGVTNLPAELQKHATLDATIKTAIANTFYDLPQAECGSVVRWYTMLACATSTAESHNNISELAINLLKEISTEIDNRWDPFCALLSTRFGLYGYPFEPEIFDFDFPNFNRHGFNSPAALSNVIRSSATILPVTSLDIKRLSSIDGVDFRTFPHLIRGKSISNQLRGLLEVVQLHFSCVQTSEATRVDNMDTVNGNGVANVVIEEVMMIPKLVTAKDKDEELLSDLVNDVECLVEEIKDKDPKTAFNAIGLLNGYKDKNSMVALEKALKHEVQMEASLDNFKMSKSTIWNTYLEKNIGLAEDPDPEGGEYDELGDVEAWQQQQHQLAKQKLLQHQMKLLKPVQASQKQAATPANQLPAADTTHNDIEMDDDAESEKIRMHLNANPAQPIAWHKLITPPPKQMIVIERMHSGARRFVVLDFGQPILLTDLMVPACDELTSLHIDIWCFDEESDCTRLVTVSDIQTKTLVLSDLQPPPICRYLKMTIIGRIGMSSTKCKVPLGTFFGHPIILDHDGYGDHLVRYIKQSAQSLQSQTKALNSLYEDVHCRYSLASCKLMELLAPMRHSELSNVAHMQAFINKQRDEEICGVDNNKVVSIYEECMLLQYQINVIRNILSRLDRALTTSVIRKPPPVQLAMSDILRAASRDKLRVLSLNLIEVLLHFSIEYGIKNILPVHQKFNVATAKMLFNSLVVYGDAHLQLATCSLLVRMCCFQPWWGDFLADTFCNLFSAQNCKAFPQDRIFFLLTYLGRRSIAMGTCRSIVIDAVLKTLVKLLAPISPHYNYQSEQASTSASAAERNSNMGATSDLQLITWLLLFLSVCLDDNNERKDKSAARWDFMSCESDFTKSRPSSAVNGKQVRCFKKRIIQQNKYSLQPYMDWGKKIYMIQNEHPGIFMDMSKGKLGATGKPTAGNGGKLNMQPPGLSATTSISSSSSSSSSSAAKQLTPVQAATTCSPKHPAEFSAATGSSGDSNFNKGLKALRLVNIKVVIRGLFALLLEMDFDCNMDQFLLTCKVIARLVAACRPSVQLCKIVTTTQLEQLIRLAVWNDQQQPWAVHAITCLLQDILDADKQYRDSDATPTNDGLRSMETAVQETRDIFTDFSSVKYNYLPSLIECEDTEFDEMFNDIDMIERTKPISKKESNALCKNTFNFFCKSISVALDARLDAGLELHSETQLRRLTNRTSLDLYSSLPQVLTNEFVTTPPEAAPWPEYLTQLWSGPDYNARNTYIMFKNVFDSILADLHYEDTWVHLEQVLHMWLTLNCELADKPYTAGITQNDIPKIPFGAHAVQGLLLALAWHNDIKLRTWCLGFQCLFLACNSLPIGDDVADSTRINEVIINDEHFEKMLLRFFSGYGMSSSIITNRCAGPTICKHLHELLIWLHSKSEHGAGLIACKRRLKDILLHVVLQLVQPGGAISNQQGPIDAQNQLVRDLLLMPNDKGDLNIALKIIESVSFLVYNNISNGDKLQCQRANDNSNTGNNFSNLFANVLGSENPNKPNANICDNSLIINLLKLSSHMVLTEMPRQPREVTIPEEEELSNQSQTDETKVEQLNTEGHRSKVPCIADWVLRHFPTMKRLYSSLSQCSTNAFTMMSSNCFFSMKTHMVLDEPQTIADAVFSLMITLSEKASIPRLVVAPICQYLEETTIQRNVTLPRLQLSEPFLWYISKVLEVTTAVQIFTQLGGIQIICHNLVRLNKTIINMQPGLISLIMQHMTRNTRLKLNSHVSNNNAACKKNCPTSGPAPTTAAQPPRNSAQYDGLINFAPFSHIISENDAAQSAEVLISNPNATHRRPRSPAWSYMFYPNETHVDLTITLPTAILLKEVQLVPHTSSLASCPSAVALELSRDYGLGSIPVGPPMATTGLTCIRLKLAKAEVATSIVLRLYKPKDCGNVGLVQIAVLGQTIFGNRSQALRAQNAYANSSLGCATTMPAAALNAVDADAVPEDDAFAKTSIGWVRILSRCFHVASLQPDSKLADLIASYPASYPGFLEACCSLLNIMPMIPSLAQQHLETILLKLGTYNHDLSLQLLRTLLWHTTPQVFKLSSDAVCDLIQEVVTSSTEHMASKIRVLLDWVMQLHDNYSKQARCNNPQSGFVKVIASILWSVHEDQQLAELPELITPALFETCCHWIAMLEHDEPLKTSFDSLMCALCYIKPELFNQLLGKVGVNLPPQSRGLTDDNKGQSGSAWFKKAGTENLAQLLQRPSYLKTLALACQSPLAVYKMLDSGLPKLLAHAVYEYCTHMLPTAEPKPAPAASAASTSSAAAAMQNEATTSNAAATTTAISLTDYDKAGASVPQSKPLLSSINVPKVLEFFTECCAEGPMRDWLGTMQGSMFWKPLLLLLCNTHSVQFNKTLPMQQTFIRLERATINFFTRVSACHPMNQEALTGLLIGVIICKPLRTTAPHARPTISGFTRQLVLQLLLENEHITVSVRSKQPLQRRDTLSAIMNASLHGQGGTTSSSQSLPVAAVNHHPAKRSNAYHILFSVTTGTTCKEIMQNCVSDQRTTSDGVAAAVNAVAIQKSSESKLEKSCLNAINFNNVEAGSMEFLTVGAAVAAKDKRIKDVKNQAAVNNEKDTQSQILHCGKLFNVEEFLLQTANANNGSHLIIPAHPDIVLAADANISQVLASLQEAGHSLAAPYISFELVPQPCNAAGEAADSKKTKAVCTEPLPSPLQRFSSNGGLSLLAHYLPTVYPENTGRKTMTVVSEKEKSPPLSDWVKLEPNDEIYEDLEDTICEPSAKQTTVSSVPQHSLAAFGLFLRLPAYSDVLLRDKQRAQCLLRLVLGVTGDGEGNDIYSLALAPTLPTLPFEVFRLLLDSVPLTTDDGVLLRRVVIEVGAMHLVLNCLGIFSHQSHNNKIGVVQTDASAAGNSKSSEEPTPSSSDDKSHMYWAKGTGFGTGSTTQSWNVEQALLRQKSEEEHVTVLLQVLSSYINPGDCIPIDMSGEDILVYHDVLDMARELPPLFQTLLQQSCLVAALSSYLRNDSVLDITRHIPLYRAILKLLRALSLSKQLVSLLQPNQNVSGESTLPIIELLNNMKTCVDTYAKRLKVNKKSNIKGQTQQLTFNIDDGDDEGLALLIPDIHETCLLVQKTIDAEALINMSKGNEDLERMPLSKSIEQRYLDVMKPRQFDTYDMIVESENNGYRFAISHHFEKMVRLTGDRYSPARVKRLAQEAVTLSTSLPLSFSSSVFVRCDTDRLDVMKVLITGPADTPYANGCFEFDVFFPSDYPNMPMQINLETTGRHTVRFNPNLYNDGKVCLSVLNTWHGRPEEKWNAQTSSFLQVLVSIQSLILVPEPYFNEPGFERSRGTPNGTDSSREYNSNIYQTCVRWAMLEQIRNPSPCFRDVIHKHFWLKREEICNQIEGWINELSKPQHTERTSRTISFNSMVLRRHYRHLREELAKLKPPRGLEDLDAPFNPVTSLPLMDVSVTTPTSTSAINVAANVEDALVPNLNLVSDEDQEAALLVPKVTSDSDMFTNSPHMSAVCEQPVVLMDGGGEEEVIEILSDTENESGVWQDKDDEMS